MARRESALAEERLVCWLCDWWWALLLLVVLAAGGGYGYSRLRPTPSSPTQAPEPALGTGDVQVTLRWATIDDLDLWVTDPAGETVFYHHPFSESGGKLDVDANANCNNVTSHPVENIFWPAGRAPKGHYRVEVMYYDHCRTSGEEAVPFHVRVLVDGVVHEFDGRVLSKGERKLIFEFDRR